MKRLWGSSAPVPSELPEVNPPRSIELDPLCFEELLLVYTRAHFALGIHHPMPRDRRIAIGSP